MATINVNSSLTAKGGLTVQGSTAISAIGGDTFAQEIDLSGSAYKSITTGSILASKQYIFVKNQITNSVATLAIDAAGTNTFAKLGYNDAIVLKPVSSATVAPYYASSSLGIAGIQVIAVES